MSWWFHTIQGVVFIVLVAIVLYREFFVITPRFKQNIDKLKYHSLKMRQIVTEFGAATIRPEVVGIYDEQIAARLYGVVGDCQLLLLDVPPNYQMARHVHADQEEFYICLHGMVEIVEYDQDDSTQVKTSSIHGIGHGHSSTHIPAGVWHSMTTTDRGAKIMAVVKPPFSCARSLEEE